MTRTARFAPAALCALAAFAAAPARADVVAAAPDGFVLHFEGTIPMTPEAAWDRLLDVSSWWNAEHSYSGEAANLSINPVAGGCWCEVWEGGAVEHGRVLMLNPPVQARFDAPFGPLQGMGVTAVLTVTMSYPDPDLDQPAGTTPVAFDFAVSGSSLSELEAMAPVVDQVIGFQFQHFIAPEGAAAP